MPYVGGFYLLIYLSPEGAAGHGGKTRVLSYFNRGRALALLVLFVVTLIYPSSKSIVSP